MQRKKPSEEIGIDEAAEILKMSVKTIRNYIKLKKIIAKKVANCWYIDKDSVMKIAQEENTEPSADTPPACKEKPQEAASAIHKLACYRLFLIASKEFDFKSEPDDIKSFFARECREALSFLGAGYYAYGRSKRYHYEMARASIGKILANLAADPALYGRHQRAAQLLEYDVLPAFGALMRKLERSSDPHRRNGGSAQETNRVP